MVQQTNKPVNNVELKKEIKSSVVVKEEVKNNIIEQKNDNIIRNDNPLLPIEDKKVIVSEVKLIKPETPVVSSILPNQNTSNSSGSSSSSNSNTFIPIKIVSRTEEQIKSEFISNNTSSTPKFDVVKEVNEGIRNSHITVFFKSDNKIRAGNFEKKEFKSLSGYDITNINEIMKSYNVRTLETTDSALTKTEAQLEYEKKESELVYGSYYPNKADIFYISVEHTNIKELIDKLRSDSNVLSANESA